MEHTHKQEMEEIKSDNKSKKFPQILAAALGEFIENLCEKKITTNAHGPCSESN